MRTDEEISKAIAAILAETRAIAKRMGCADVACSKLGHEYDPGDLDDQQHDPPGTAWRPKCVHCGEPKAD